MFRQSFIRRCAKNTWLVAAATLLNALVVPFDSIALNTNQQGVTTQLEGITFPTATQNLIISTLSLLPSDEAERSLEQMSGEVYTNSSLISGLASRKFIRRLYDPLRPLFKTTSCFEDGDYYKCYECDGLCYAYGEPLKAQFHDDDLTFWLNLGGGQSILKHDNNAGGFKLSNLEVNLGGHTALNHCWTLGAGIGYEYDYTHYNIGGSGNNSTMLIGLYSLYRPHTFYLLSDLVFGYNQSRIKRSIAIGDLSDKPHTNPKSYQGTFYIETGKRFDYGILGIQPFLGFEVAYFHGCQFSESHSDLDLQQRFKDSNQTNSSSRLGLHLSSNGPASLSFDFDIAWQYLFFTTSNSLRGQFKNFGDFFKVKGVKLSCSSFDAEAMVSAQLNDTWSLYTEFSGQRWERAATYSITGGFMGKW